MASERWTPAIAAKEERQAAMIDTSDQIEQLRKTLAKQKKAELIQAITELASIRKQAKHQTKKRRPRG